MMPARNWGTFVILAAAIALVAVVAELLGVRLLVRIATNLCISMVLVIGLQIFMGNSGILSFAHVGFMGVGAYVSAVVTIPVQMKGMALPNLYPILADVQVSPYVGMALGGLVAALVAAVAAYPLMRLSDAAAVITSFALFVVLHTIMYHWSDVTNGPRTLFGLPGGTTLPLAAAVAIGSVLLALLFKESRIGRLLRASRDDEIAAASLGAHIPRLRWQAFVVSALLAGVGGALWGHFITSFSPKQLWLKETFVILAMLVIGGPRTVTGAVVGVLVVTASFEGLRALEGAINRAKILSEPLVGMTELTLAVAMIAVLALRPGGNLPVPRGRLLPVPQPREGPLSRCESTEFPRPAVSPSRKLSRSDAAPRGGALVRRGVSPTTWR